jgi:hypothetical protein
MPNQLTMIHNRKEGVVYMMKEFCPAQIMDGVVLSDNAFNLNVAQTWVVPLKKMMMMRNGNRFYSGGDFYDR